MTEPYRIRSAETWVQARDDYLSGLHAEAVCRRYDLGLSAFRRRARKYGWRRIDQDDPAPAALDLSIYEDVDIDDLVQTARLRFAQALETGRAVEAARWRRLWHELCVERNALDAEVFSGMAPTEVAALLAAEAAQDETEDEILQLSAPAVLPGPRPGERLAASEKVHDVHSVSSERPSAADGAGRGCEAP